MNIKELNATIENDRSNSLLPWLVIASGGTTGTGSIDPLKEIANICKKYNCWFHIDAAYGGMFALLPTLQQQLPLALADSFVIDPHKAMFLPYGCGAVFVADGELLRESLSDGGAILAGIESFDHRSANDYSLELTRPSRGAQIWTVLRAHGQDCIAAALEEKLLLASYFHHLLDESNLFEVFPAQDLTVVVFRLSGNNERTEKLLKNLTKQGHYLLSSTILNEKLYIRCCILNFRTHLVDVESLYAELIK
jgi:glutamate/tyrosine decarboxylase-like PLP-dependent enzyme